MFFNSKSDLPLVFILMYLGSIPFLALSSMKLLGNPSDLFGIELTRLASTYCILIGAFMAGIHWGQHLKSSPISPVFLVITSNVMALAYWFSYLLLTFEFHMILSSGLFIIILVVDYFMVQLNALTRRYFYHRCIVTTIVVLNLLYLGLS